MLFSGILGVLLTFGCCFPDIDTTLAPLPRFRSCRVSGPGRPREKKSEEDFFQQEIFDAGGETDGNVYEVGKDGEDEDEGGDDGSSVEDIDAAEMQEQAVDEALHLLRELDAQCSGEQAEEPTVEDEVPREAVELAEAVSGEGGGDQSAGSEHDALEWARAPGVADIRFPLERGAGEIRYSLTGDYMRAFCPIHKDCVRQRSCRAHASASTALTAGQGRPIGALVAWLQQARHHRQRKDHIAAQTASHAERMEARTAFYLLEGGMDFSNEYERPRREDEAEEPSSIR